MMRRSRLLIALLGAAVLVLGACSSDDDGDGVGAGGGPEVLAISATDAGDGTGYGFGVADTVAAGTYEISLANEGTEDHHGQLFKLNADKTFADLGAAAAGAEEGQEIPALLAVGVFDGGTATVAPGTSSSVNAVTELTEGTYVLMCFVENSDGVAHVDAGMVQPFTVTASEEPAEAVASDASIDLVDFGFELPDTVSTGSVLDVTNASEAEAHEINIISIDEGGSFEAFQGLLSGEGEPPEGPPPFTSVGGVQALMPGASQQISVDVPAGEYIFICFIPSAANEGAPHFTLGMVTQVTVT